ncbi:response regulator [Lacrimispora sp. NSJ-141]|uniref:Circadian input-output histidine kinase CikA n=1 Tax=Lientehia hominis TaxID=2897778 RepID=A0AAP2RHC6_9FIRM|nr:PAS domain-containing hybrid sensor histidine kinase/response regulator [Lientehia hominis]MCD2491856.1 response regulator [Lientehia hominis]
MNKEKGKNGSQMLEKILNHMGDTAVYAIRRDTHELLFFNDRVKAVSPGIQIGHVCHEIWEGYCKNCPLLTLGKKESNTTVSYDDPFGKVVDISATKIDWGPEEIPAYLISVTPHTFSIQEQELELEREKLAAVAGKVYPVIYSVNLTKNTYSMVEFQSSESYLPPSSGKFDDLPFLASRTVHPDYQEQYIRTFGREKLLEDYKNGIKELGLEFLQLYRDGSYQWVSVQVIFLENTLSDDVMEITLCKNIHEQRLAQKKKERERQAVYDSLPGGIVKCLADESFTILSMSRNFREMFGIMEGNERKAADLFQGKEREADLAYCRSCAAAGKPIRLDGQSTDSMGRCIWLHLEGKMTGEQDGVPEYTMTVLDITGRKETEEELKQERMKYKIAVESAADVFFEYFPEEDLFLSQENPEIGGRAARLENYRQIMRDILHPEDIGLVDSVLGGELRQAEVRIIPYGGSGYRWYLVQGDLIRKDGEKERVVGTLRDITQLKQREELYRSRETLMTASIMTLFGELLVLDVETGRFMAYKSSSGMEAIKEQEDFTLFCKEYGGNLIHPEDRGRFFSIFSMENIRKNAKEGRKKLLLEARRLDEEGHYRWCELMGNLLEDEEVNVMLLTFRDIHELYMARAESRIANERLLTSVNHFYDAIYEWNLTGGEAYAWKGFQGYPESFRMAESVKEHFERVLWEYIHPDYREEFKDNFAPERLTESFKERQSEHFMEFRNKCPDGQYYWFTMNMQLLENVDGELRAMIYMKNVDRQKKEQERQKQALQDALSLAEQASLAKSDFLSRMSHDIRTPMNAIIGMTAIAAVSLDNKEKMRDCLGKIGLSARYLLSLLNDVLDMSKIESGKMDLAKEPFDFRELVQSVTQMIYAQASAKRQEFTVMVDERLESTYIGDSLRINQILMNLLSNAVKYTGESGHVSLRLESMRQTKDKEWLRIQVSDDGIGISEEFQQKMFQPFEQESQESGRVFEGSGLGLSIVQNLLRMMDGSIAAESGQGEGTCFTVELPLQRTGNGPAEDCMFPEDMEVLVTDDDPFVCEQAQAILNHMGVKVEWVVSGAEAVESVRRRSDRGEKFDVAIIDWKMPGMDGVETARQIRRIVGKDILVIVMSAYDWSDVEEEARAAGVDLFLAKPFFTSTLGAVLRQAAKTDMTEEKRQLKEETAFDHERVLLVEDSEINREIAQTLLEMRGIQVDTAEDGRIAVEKFLSARSGTYQAVLMDIRMPHMDGLEATRRIRSSDHPDAGRMPIIAMTANAFEDERQEAEKAGINEYLTKPIEQELLFGTLYRVFHSGLIGEDK